MNPKTRLFTLSSIYILKCLTRDQMVEIARKIEKNPNWDKVDQLGFDSETIIAPKNVGSAGRYFIKLAGTHKIFASAIFSYSVPFDVMVNLEVNFRGDLVECIEEAKKYKKLLFSQIDEIISEGDVDCITVLTNRDGLAQFVDFMNSNKYTIEVKPSFTSDDLIIATASHPLNCQVVCGVSEALVIEAQTAIQNFYRIIGASQHITHSLETFKNLLTDLESKVNLIVNKKQKRVTKKRLNALRTLRTEFFEFEKIHSNFEIEFGSFQEYETLYLELQDSDRSQYKKFTSDIRTVYLLPVKLFDKQIETRFKNVSDFINDALNLTYSEINLRLVESAQILSVVQAILALLLILVAIAQLLNIFSGFSFGVKGILYTPSITQVPK